MKVWGCKVQFPKIEGIFHFPSQGSYFLKYKTFFRISVPRNIRKCTFLKSKKSSFCWENARNFFRVVFFLFYELAPKSVLGIFAKGSIIYVWQCSEFASGSEYATSCKYIRVLNIPFLKYKKVLFPQSFFWENIENFFTSVFFRNFKKKFFDKQIFFLIHEFFIFYFP